MRERKKIYFERTQCAVSFFQSVTKQWSVNSVKELEGFQIFIFLKKYKAKGLAWVGRNEAKRELQLLKKIFSEIVRKLKF
jgi:hypothetical protein